jgi:hypothetical protein
MAVALSRLSVKTFRDCEPQFDDDLVTLVSQVGKPPRFAPEAWHCQKPDDL